MNVFENQYKEINSHVRHVAQLVVTWYTFFVTANIVTIGWFATADQTKTLRFVELVPWLVRLFFFVNILGCAALLYVISYFRKENRRLEDGLAKIVQGQAGDEAFNGSPFSLRIYTSVVIIMMLSLLAIAIVWCALGGIVQGKTTSAATGLAQNSGPTVLGPPAERTADQACTSALSAYPRTRPVPKHNVSAQGQRQYPRPMSVPKNNVVPRQKNRGQEPAQRHAGPNKRVQATANKLRSFLAPLVGRA